MVLSPELQSRNSILRSGCNCASRVRAIDETAQFAVEVLSEESIAQVRGQQRAE
jgi:hypothetical protein